MSMKVYSCMVQGIEGKLVEVETDILPGLPSFSIVGLADASVQEARQRIHSAIKNSGFQYPQQKKIINLAPAYVRKNGAHFDLPMALGLLSASKQTSVPDDALFVGELALNGEIKSVNGVISFMLFAKEHGWKKIFLPEQNLAEASLIKGPEIYPLQHLQNLLLHLQQRQKIEPKRKNWNVYHESPEVDFSSIQGQEHGKRALEIAAAGGHHVLFFGPPGVGKTLLAKAFSGILPPLSDEEHFQVVQIYSSAGMLEEKVIVSNTRPFRNVHHTISKMALIGGGNIIRPGEISLAHQGVLFLDEIGEFPKSHLEALRQPLEEKKIAIARHSGNFLFPTDFTLIAAMNPCPCGYLGDTEQNCRCTSAEIAFYHKKLSGPILDRLDIVLAVPRVSLKKQNSASFSSDKIRGEVLEARRIQKERLKKEKISVNSHMGIEQIKKYCSMSADVEQFALEASEKLRLSMRSYHQLIKVARTIADLSRHDHIEVGDLSEALQYRQRFS